MSKAQSIIIGLPVRNEAKSLFRSLESIRAAMIAARKDDIILVICINGCTDDSELIAKDFRARHDDIQCEIIKSPEGLVNAQRAIVRSYRADIYVFPDADNVIAENSIVLLLQALRADRGLVVAYAKTAPLRDKENKSIFHILGLLYDSQTMLSKRYYFHGRLFATRKWYVPENEEILRRAHLNKRNEVMLKYCSNGILLSADDIFMSSYIMDGWGLSAIKQVEDALCYSWSVGSLRDWLNIYRRRNIEMEKMYRWFPEYNYLKPYLNRRTDWKKWLKVSLSNKIFWLLFILMKAVFALWLRIELFSLNSDFYRPSRQWFATSTTKK